NGGTGTGVDGNDNTINNGGKNTADGEGSTGTDVTGNGNDINNTGDNGATGGGTGTDVDGNDNTINNGGKNTADGEGSTGTDVTGDGNDINNTGDNGATNGGTGTDVTGDGNTIDNKGNNTADGAGSTGTDVDGNGNKIINEGDTSAAAGGTGTSVDGNDNTIDNKGKNTADGEGSTGTDVTGDGNKINNEGDTSATSGATGTNVDGNGNEINNNGANSADGAGSTGTNVSGDDNTINSKGDTSAKNGATGTDITGDGNKYNNTGDITAEGENSTGVNISGNKATVDNEGEINVSNGASGINITGDDATVTNKGAITVSDNATGIKITGDNANVAQGGDISLPIATDGQGTLQPGTGLDIIGNHADVTVSGKIDFKTPQPITGLVSSAGKITGVHISGSDNNLTVSGATNFDVEGNLSNFTGKLVALDVSGENNTVNLTGGFNQLFDGRAASNSGLLGIGIDGANNIVNVSGESTFTMTSAANLTQHSGDSKLAKVSGGSKLNLTATSTLVVDVIAEHANNTYQSMEADMALMSSTGEGSSIVNMGNISTPTVGNLLLGAENGASVENKGTISVSSVSATQSADTADDFVMGAFKGATATNSGTISVINTQEKAVGSGNYHNQAPFSPGWRHHYVMVGNDNTSLENTGEININGVSTWGMAVTNHSSAVNKATGTINLDGFRPVTDENGVITSKADAGLVGDKYQSAAMMAGNEGGASFGNNSSAVNEGNINVSNAGYGMAAFAGGTATNKGTITLTGDSTAAANGQLAAMAVFGGGTIINDDSGQIIINAANGQAFFSDGNVNNRIINRGAINLGTNVPATADNSADLETQEFVDGSILTGTTTLSRNASVMSGSTVSNTGTVDGTSTLTVEGIYNNQTGAVTSAPLTVNASGVVNNSGTLSGKTTVSGKMVNTGTMTRGATMNGSGKVTNSGAVALGSSSDASNASILELKNNSVFDNLSGGTIALDNNKNAVHLNNDSTLKNEKGGTITVTNSSTGAGINIWGGTADFINDGTATATGKTLVGSSSDAAAGKAFAWNQDDGVINFTATASGQSAVSLTNSNYVGINDGTMNLSGSGAIGMKGSKNAQLVNNGTINLGTTGTDETGMIAMQLDAGATADAVIENNGAINIYAKDSYAFSRLGANGRIINNGTVLLEGTGSGLVKESDVTVEGNGTGGNGTETHAASYTLPTDPTVAPVQSKGLRSSVSQYTIGTSASGTAGTLTADYVDLGDVDVDTGFTAGTAATTQTFNDVFVGEDIQGEQNIKSTSVVWSAQGQKDANGNVDVTMTKNAYTDVVTDSSVSGVAGALDAAYTNNELFSSLNLKTSADVTKAMKQISGNKAVNVSRDARRLSNRFDMLADAAPELGNGLSFNLVAKGDQRAELGKDTQYDMMALRQKLGFGDNQSLTMEYGIARLDGKGNVSSGSDGITGGYSQFLGLEHAMPLGEEGLSWNNALRYDVHQLDSKRGINYGDVNKQALADSRQQYLELRTEGRKTFTVSEGLDVVPYAGLKLRHTMEDGYQERGAGDFNLNMNSSTETAVDSVVGMKLSYAGKDGWAATATLEGGPNLSYVSTGKKASLQGAAGQSFNVDDGQKGGSINSMAQVGVKYNAGNTSAGLDAFHWKEDNISDKGFMLNIKHNF
ncbi:TPA: hypothetical protein R8G35_003282, partial [Citrobacter braakii]|nr:hypothetical protein [Citrobacter braakii]